MSSRLAPITKPPMDYVLLVTMALVTACISDNLLHPAPVPADPRPVALAIEIDNGVATPLQVRPGQTYYLNQIDLRASTTSTTDEGVAGLLKRGDFSDLTWSNIRREQEEFVLLPNAGGTFTRRALFRDAVWMNVRSLFRLEQADQRGEILGRTIVVDAGLERDRRKSDDYLERRFKAIQWAHDCRTNIDCAGATAFEEEALVELRNTMHPDRTFTIAPRARSLRLHWSLHPDRAYTIPITRVPSPLLRDGFSVDEDGATPPPAIHRTIRSAPAPVDKCGDSHSGGLPFFFFSFPGAYAG